MNQELDHLRQLEVYQFQAVRGEIVAMQRRVVRLQYVGVFLLPILIVLATKVSVLNPLLFFLPLMVAVLMLMLVYSQNCVMRGGHYIREYIEPVSNNGEYIGWETFLEKNTGVNRFAERVLLLSVVVALGFYYLMGWYFILEDQYTKGKHLNMVFCSVGYLAVIIGVCLFAMKNFPTCASTLGFSLPDSERKEPVND